jgi:hypothetical protein
MMTVFVLVLWFCDGNSYTIRLHTYKAYLQRIVHTVLYVVDTCYDDYKHNELAMHRQG